MPIVCLEGPSAVGKTSTASALTSLVAAYVVPEVNELFQRPEDETPEWYFERQVERYALSASQVQHHPLVVLDGDPFQPLWYNWAYDFTEWQSLNFLEEFYRPRLLRGDLNFPDLYVVLTSDVAALRERKEADSARRRRGFETHLRFIEPQRRYFEAMQHILPEHVCFLEAREVGQTAEAVIVAALESRAVERPVELFDNLVQWLRETPAPAA